MLRTRAFRSHKTARVVGLNSTTEEKCSHFYHLGINLNRTFNFLKVPSFPTSQNPIINELLHFKPHLKKNKGENNGDKRQN